MGYVYVLMYLDSHQAKWLKRPHQLFFSLWFNLCQNATDLQNGCRDTDVVTHDTMSDPISVISSLCHRAAPPQLIPTTSFCIPSIPPSVFTAFITNEQLWASINSSLWGLQMYPGECPEAERGMCGERKAIRRRSEMEKTCREGGGRWMERKWMANGEGIAKV